VERERDVASAGAVFLFCACAGRVLCRVWQVVVIYITCLRGVGTDHKSMQ